MHEAAVAAAIFFLTLAYGAGAYAMALGIAKKQLNGLGARLNRVVAAVIHICPADKREEVTALLLGLKKELK